MAVDLARQILAGFEDEIYVADCEFPMDTLDNASEPDTLMEGWLLVYPNPADAYVNIEHTWEDESQMKIIVLNHQGSIVWEEDFPEGENEMELNTSEWQQGAYYVILTKDSAYLESKILIVYHP